MLAQLARLLLREPFKQKPAAVRRCSAPQRRPEVCRRSSGFRPHEHVTNKSFHTSSRARAHGPERTADGRRATTRLTCSRHGLHRDKTGIARRRQFICVQPDYPVPPVGPALDQPGIQRALRRQMRSLRGVELTAMVMLTAIVTTAALQGDGSAAGYVAVEAVCSIGLIEHTGRHDPVEPSVPQHPRNAAHARVATG